METRTGDFETRPISLYWMDLKFWKKYREPSYSFPNQIMYSLSWFIKNRFTLLQYIVEYSSWIEKLMQLITFSGKRLRFILVRPRFLSPHVKFQKWIKIMLDAFVWFSYVLRLSGAERESDFVFNYSLPWKCKRPWYMESQRAVTECLLVKVLL